MAKACVTLKRGQRNTRNQKKKKRRARTVIPNRNPEPMFELNLSKCIGKPAAPETRTEHGDPLRERLFKAIYIYTYTEHVYTHVHTTPFALRKKARRQRHESKGKERRRKEGNQFKERKELNER